MHRPRCRPPRPTFRVGSTHRTRNRPDLVCALVERVNGGRAGSWTRSRTPILALRDAMMRGDVFTERPPQGVTTSSARPTSPGTSDAPPATEGPRTFPLGSAIGRCLDVTVRAG